MKTTIKTAVIGVGNMGKNHARVYSEISNLVAVSDLIFNTGKKIAKKYQARFYQDYQKMLDKEKPEAVSVVVPTKFHKKVAINCLKRKIPTLVEKPIADSLKAAQAILKQAQKNKTFLMVGHIERFNPAVVKLKKLINQRKFGRIISLLAIRVGINPPKLKNSDVVLDLAIHDIDIFNFLLEEFPKRKKIVTHKIFKNNLTDSASLLLEYKNTTAIVQTNWITPIKIRKLYVTGTKSFCELDYILQKLIIFDKILSITPKSGFSGLVALSKTPKKEVFVSQKEPLRQELKFFLKNIKNYQLIDNVKQAIMALRILS